ncbi:hypothetical protein BDFB_013609, partial [Asbolus verrucosus]
MDKSWKMGNGYIRFLVVLKSFLSEFLREFYDERIVDFPPRSPDLTILDYYVFPHLKNTIFKSSRHTVEELMEAI